MLTEDYVARTGWEPGQRTPERNPDSFDAFSEAVKSSVDKHAKRKNYTDNEVDGKNKLVTVMTTLGFHTHHCLGEIIYKSAEYARNPRRVLLEKIAGWAFILWRETPQD